ncbi:MAG: hypothetical protein KatS3mg115_0451 [Candidatus Poribacteria bacterium]|nr:MAG: hypothetical protein KatS3mg115_0451 [Candidatus Poribacteria bacterium]
MLPPTRREIVGLDSSYRWGPFRLEGLWALSRHDRNLLAEEPISEAIAWRLGLRAEEPRWSLDASAERLGADYVPIGATGAGRRSYAYGEEFAAERFGDALLSSEVAFPSRTLGAEEPPAEGRYSLRWSLEPLRGITLSGNGGLTYRDQEEDSQDETIRTYGGQIRWQRRRWPTLRLGRQWAEVITGGARDFSKDHWTGELSYRWQSAELLLSRSRFLANDEAIADGVDRNRSQDRSQVQITTGWGERLLLRGRYELEENRRREPIVTAGLPVGYGPWEPAGVGRTLSLETSWQPHRELRLSGRLGRRELSAGEEEGTRVSALLTSLSVHASPLARALTLHAEYGLDRRLTSRREEIFTNVILVDGRPLRLKPGQGTHVRVDEFHYLEDPEEGDYVRVVRTLSDVPVLALESQFHLGVEPRRYFQRGSPEPEGWRQLLSMLRWNLDWTLIEEQETEAVSRLLRMEALRSERTVYGSESIGSRWSLQPNESWTLDWEDRRLVTLNRRFNQESRSVRARTALRSARWRVTERWTLEGQWERRTSSERMTTPGEEPGTTVPAESPGSG